MKSFRKELWFNLPARRGFVNITDQVAECVRESGPWEQIFYGEFDGRRRKRVLVKVIGE